MFNRMIYLRCISFSILALPTLSIAQPSIPTVWEHNGSTVYLVANGQTREFYYQEPRSGMIEAGARRGALLFAGVSINGSYEGTAYIYRGSCGRYPYRVSGPILDNHEHVLMRGQAPRVGPDCRVKGYTTDTLEFTLLRSENSGQHSSSSIPSGFLGIWIEAGANNNTCAAKEYDTRTGGKYDWDYYTRLVEIDGRSLEAWELICKLDASRGEISSQDRTSVELSFVCNGGAMSWKVDKLWNLQTINDRKTLTITSLRYSDWRDDAGRRIQQETPRKQTATYLECK